MHQAIRTWIFVNIIMLLFCFNAFDDYFLFIELLVKLLAVIRLDFA